jgi:ABC-type branched-subunit amino acid transport system ATPase component
MPVSSFSPQTARVAQNVFLNREIKGATGLVDDESAEKETRKLFDLLEVDINPTALVEDLGAGQKQLTEIVKAISQNARILTLDEPSTALSVEDVERLFSFLKSYNRTAFPLSMFHTGWTKFLVSQTEPRFSEIAGILSVHLSQNFLSTPLLNTLWVRNLFVYPTLAMKGSKLAKPC